MTGAAAHTDPGARLVVLAESLFEELAARVRDFLSTEKGGAVVLLCAALAALLWANSPWPASYESFWATKLSIRVGGGGISMDLRSWVNQGLMSFFFLVVGLEARRELTLGELRERRRLTIPVVAAAAGMALPIAIYLAFNAGGPGAHGWGAAMSTDTAFALGVLALVAPGGTRLHVFLLTLAVVDDLVALLVIATAYTNHVSFVPLAVASASPARSPCSATRRSPGAGRPRRCSASRCGSRCSSRVSIR
jgi:Na+/H+ antiporter NhaA